MATLIAASASHCTTYSLYKQESNQLALGMTAKVSFAFDAALAIAMVTIGILIGQGVIGGLGVVTPVVAYALAILGPVLLFVDVLVLINAKQPPMGTKHLTSRLTREKKALETTIAQQQNRVEQLTQEKNALATENATLKERPPVTEDGDNEGLKALLAKANEAKDKLAAQLQEANQRAQAAEEGQASIQRTWSAQCTQVARLTEGLEAANALKATHEQKAKELEAHQRLVQALRKCVETQKTASANIIGEVKVPVTEIERILKMLKGVTGGHIASVPHNADSVSAANAVVPSAPPPGDDDISH